LNLFKTWGRIRIWIDIVLMSIRIRICIYEYRIQSSVHGDPEHYAVINYGLCQNFRSCTVQYILYKVHLLNFTAVVTPDLVTVKFVLQFFVQSVQQV